MLEYPYIFWQVFLAYAAPTVATACALTWIRFTESREPLWAAVPVYIAVHLLAFALSSWCHLDYDWLQYLTYNSLVWSTLYWGAPGSWLLGLGTVLWVGIRRGSRRLPRHGFQLAAVRGRT